MEPVKKNEQLSASALSSNSSFTQHDPIGRVSKGASTDDQLKGQQTAIREMIGDIPVEQLPAASLDLTQTPEAHGIIAKDFASSLEKEHKSQGPFTSEGLFTTPSISSAGQSSTKQLFAEQPSSERPPTERPSTEQPTQMVNRPVSVEQGESEVTRNSPSNFNTSLGARLFAQGGFASALDSSFEHSSSGNESSSQFFSSETPNTMSQKLSSSTSHESSSMQTSSVKQQSSLTSEKIQAGGTTFSLPNFGDHKSGEDRAAGQNILSPTQPAAEGEERKGQGLF